MQIGRNVNGVVDFLLTKVESLEERDDIDIEKKAKIELAFLRECRGYIAADLQYKNLLIKAPDVARNRKIVMPLGTPNLIEAGTAEDSAEKPKEEEITKAA